ncbi:hypothetical protein [Aeromonas molluscorum]|uniref:hypothetical protein n=1 Tax=Aeromonas molluscorum TaxID=271417 RepID=UPI003F1C4BEE
MRKDRYFNENWDELSHKISWRELMLRINVLRHSKNIEATHLMHRLLNCSPDERCGSLACPICISIDRKKFTKSVMELLSKSPNKSFITYVPYPILSSDIRIYDINIKYVKDKFRCYLKNSNITSCVVGCVEIDYDFETKRWVPHIHVISEDIPISNLKDMRKKINTKHLSARLEAKAIPLNIKGIYCLKGLCNYIYKFMWQNKPKKSNRNYKVKKNRLSYDLFIDHLVFIDRLTMRDLEFRFRVRRNKDGLTKIP